MRKIEDEAAGDAAVVVANHVDEHVKVADADAARVHLMQHDLGDADAFVDRADRAHVAAAAGHRHVVLRDVGAVPREAVLLEIVGAVERLVGEDAGELVVVDADARIDRVLKERVGAVVGIEARHDVVAAARHARVVRAARTLGEHHDLRAGVVRSDRGTHAGRAAARDQHIGLLDQHVG